VIGRLIQLRNVLGCFLFRDEEVFKKIKVLSGGEKSRVALAKTLISESNFLLLDEPTNHLDMVSVNILVQALQQYEGTFLLVSHDRHFISQVANKIWWIEDQEIKEYPGTYQEFEWWWEKEKVHQGTHVETSKKESNSPSPKVKKTRQPENEQKKQLKKELDQVEKEIQQEEAALKTLEEELSDPSAYQREDYQQQTERHRSIRQKIEQLTSRWESIMMELE
jgi:ATP-binding cassette subfamily F protein 3